MMCILLSSMYLTICIVFTLFYVSGSETCFASNVIILRRLMQVKDGSFIANILIEDIEQMGARNVVQVITDNAKNCRVAGLFVEERYQHIFWTPCAVHSFNLMLQKIGKSI